MIKDRFGQPILEHIGEMTKIKLKRKLLENEDDKDSKINEISFRSIGISHEDERRILKEVFNSKDELKDFIAKHCKVMEIKTDSNLGGVYHDYSEIIYILKGEVFIELKNLKDNKEMSMILKQGDRIIIPKNTAHKLKAKKDTIIVELWEEPHISSDINNHKIEF
jgi:quercetin dioxygenase-like cupin family protein